MFASTVEAGQRVSENNIFQEKCGHLKMLAIFIIILLLFLATKRSTYVYKTSYDTQLTPEIKSVDMVPLGTMS